MININFLFPWEKRRIKDEVAKKIMNKYNKKVVKHFSHFTTFYFILNDRIFHTTL